VGVTQLARGLAALQPAVYELVKLSACATKKRPGLLRAVFDAVVLRLREALELETQTKLHHAG